MPRVIPQPNCNNKPMEKPVPASIEKIPPLLLTKSKNEVNQISKYFKSTSTKSHVQASKQSYVQALKPNTNTNEIIKIKDIFPALNAQKIDQIQKIINGAPKLKPHIQMTTKGPSQKQVIIPMSSDNIKKFMENSSLHVANINRSLQNAKSEVPVDFICADNSNIAVVTNKVVVQSDLYIIKNYIKKVEDINILNTDMPQLLQSKSYLKIIGIPFFPHNNSNKRFIPNDIEIIIKQNQIFDNIVLTSKPHVIKVSPKSDMSIIWFDIWNVQSGSKAKGFINRCFNIGKYIVTIRGVNMNPGIPQCKNCWRWGHTTLSYHIQGSKCIKCNGPHKSKNHHQFGWCCKVNGKTNPLRLETKKSEPCPHFFKCSNCHGDHQADSNLCLFQKNRFYCEWHIKKYNKICENRSNSICSIVNVNKQ